MWDGLDNRRSQDEMWGGFSVEENDFPFEMASFCAF